MVRAVLRPLVLVSLVAAAHQNPPAQPPTQAQQKPVFRSGTHFVRVDAYPAKDGKIIEGLKPDDFEITENGKPQTIESFDYISFPTFTPDAERRDPSSQRAGYDMAADPRYRVFVIFVDMAFGNAHDGPVVPTNGDLVSMQSPLVGFLDRVLGPRDLYAFLTSRNSARDLVLGQKTGTIKAQIDDLYRSSRIDRDDADQLDGCLKGPALKPRARLDQTYTALEGLVTQLGSLRDERKNIIFVTNSLPRPREDRSLLEATGGIMPRAGIVNGRLGIGDRQTSSNDSYCSGEAQRLAMMNFDSRYKELLVSARSENVTFYTITPAGLQAPVTPGGQAALQKTNDDLITLAHETEGVAIVNTNDLSAYYVLGYYTTNTTWDGGLRTIKVQLKSSGETIRARRQYRAPTQEEMYELAVRPAAGTRGVSKPATDRETALAVLERASRPFAVYAAINGKTLTVVTELSPSSIQNQRWKSGADVQVTATTAEGATVTMGRGKIEAGAFTAIVPLEIDSAKPPARISVDLVGPGERPANDWLNLSPSTGTLVADPIAYRSSSRVSPRPIAAFEFARNERIKVEWPVLAAALDRRDARLLDKT